MHKKPKYKELAPSRKKVPRQNAYGNVQRKFTIGKGENVRYEG